MATKTFKTVMVNSPIDLERLLDGLSTIGDVPFYKLIITLYNDWDDIFPCKFTVEKRVYATDRYLDSYDVTRVK